MLLTVTALCNFPARESRPRDRRDHTDPPRGDPCPVCSWREGRGQKAGRRRRRRWRPGGAQSSKRALASPPASSSSFSPRQVPCGRESRERASCAAPEQWPRFPVLAAAADSRGRARRPLRLWLGNRCWGSRSVRARWSRPWYRSWRR